MYEESFPLTQICPFWQDPFFHNSHFIFNRNAKVNNNQKPNETSLSYMFVNSTLSLEFFGRCPPLLLKMFTINKFKDFDNIRFISYYSFHFILTNYTQLCILYIVLSFLCHIESFCIYIKINVIIYYSLLRTIHKN